MDGLIERLAELPCGRRLLAVAAETEGIYLVGGAVRDLLLGRPPRELDVVVEGAIGPLAARLGATSTTHERFGTATVVAGECRWDLASARAEEYARPGALPDVRAAGLQEDLQRRDVTINALALDLNSGVLTAVPHAREDLAGRRLRVLHDASFVDDPTRLWRVARYAARLGFDLEEHTAQLAAQAVAAGALRTVSGARVGRELRLALAEADPLAALAAAAALGIAPWLAPDAPLARATLDLLPPGEGRRDLAVLAASMAVAAASLDDAGPGTGLEGARAGAGVHDVGLGTGLEGARAGAGVHDVGPGTGLEGAPAGAGLHDAGPGPGTGAGADLDDAGSDALLAELEFTAGERAILAACRAAPQLARDARATARRPSQLARVLRGVPIEAVALAGAHGAAQPVRRWLERLRHVALAITGDDLLASGVTQGPEVGRRLAAVLDMRLDGELGDGREAQIAAALRA